MCPVKRNLAISNLKKYTVKGTNHHQFLLAIPTVLTYTFERIYLYQSSPSSVPIPILTLNTNISRHIVTLDTTHVSALQTRL